jgi:hypothetical protein
MTTAEEIRAVCGEIEAMLLAKNAAYGDSALDPVRIFSKADAVEQIRVRIDDKLSRLMRGDGSGDEDAVGDLLGYLVLLRVGERRVKVTPGDLHHEGHEEEIAQSREGAKGEGLDLTSLTAEELEVWCQANPELRLREFLDIRGRRYGTLNHEGHEEHEGGQG